LKVPKDKPTHVAQGVLTKSHAIWMYLDDLWRRKLITVDPLDCNEWIPAGWAPAVPQQSFDCSTWTPIAGSRRIFRATGSYRHGTGTRAISLVASIDSATVASPQRTQPWNSYLVQDIELPDRNHAVLVDTSDYLNQPPSFDVAAALTFLTNKTTPDCRKQHRDYSLPGRCGEVGDSQVVEIASLLLRSRGATPMPRYFLMGHHPWHALRQDSVRWLDRLRAEQPGFITYVSGHTHASTGTYGTDSRYHWEINVASTTDWPMQYARLSYWLPEGKPALLRLDIRASAASGHGCPYGRSTDPYRGTSARREIDYGTPNAYVTRALEVYRDVVKAAIAAVPAGVKMPSCSIKGVQTDPPVLIDLISRTATSSTDLHAKRVLLNELAQCDRTTLRELPGIRELEIDCAAWASQLEYDMNNQAARLRLPERESEVFEAIVPTEQ
jgi:hypothetical protein